MQLILGILLLVMSIFLVVAVLFQQGKSHRLPGSIAGGAETFFGKTKSNSINAVLSKLTAVVAIVFVVVVIVVYIMSGTANTPDITTEIPNNDEVVVENETETEGETAEGETAEGETTEGETAEGETAEGETAEGEVVEDNADAEDAPADETVAE